MWDDKLAIAMPATTESFSEPTVPHPPRFWWLKRISSLVLIALLALAGLRWWWGRAAQARLNEAIASARARHEPVLPEDFPISTLPDDRNAAITLQRAAAALVEEANFRAMYLRNSGPLTPAELLRVGVIAENNRIPLQLVRHARSQPEADWGIGFPSIAHVQSVPELARRQHYVSQLEQWLALCGHAQGNDSEAMEHVLDLLRQADALDQGCSIYLLHRYAMSFQSRIMAVLAMITPDLRIAAGPGSPSARAGAAQVAQVREVIARLLDEHHLRDGAIGMFDGGRVMAIEVVDARYHGYYDVIEEYSAMEVWLVRPTFVLDASRSITNYSLMQSAAAQPNWPAAERILPRPAIGWTDLDRYVHVLNFESSFPRFADRMLHFPTMSDRRAAAIALAIRLYCVDHDGRFPAQLSALVPAYLSAVPVDPMAADGRPFGYHPFAHPPVIYSVGRNGIDNGGTSLRDSPDAVYPLGPLPPKPHRASGNSRRPTTRKAPSPG